MVALSTPISLTAIRHTLNDFWQWWKAELTDSLPRSCQRIFTSDRSQLFIDLGSGGIRIGAIRGERTTINTVLEASSDEALLQSTLLSASADLDNFDNHAIIHLAPEYVWKKSFILPLAAEHDLRRIIEIDLDRQSPFTPSQVYFDMEVTARDVAAGRITVQLALAKRAVVDPVIGMCVKINLNVSAVLVDSPDDNSNRLNLFRSKRLPLWSWIRQSRYAALVLILASLIIANVTIILWHQGRTVTSLTEAVVEARKTADVADKLRTQINVKEQANLVLMEKRNAPAAVALLAELSRILPDTVWLTGFEQSDQEFFLIGQTPSAADLVPLLEKSDLFKDIRFRAPVIPADRPGFERFDLAVALRSPSK